ncbi:MAG: thiolase family protein [Deltaproteobacteria bacterium]|uniref:Thiolase family protein n=1 Tax=Candidatus Zymogenus saltonus TaxID=2844893 RepID=A0A9D8PP67_9DELT|nr:thiolase family protein [Candidatus Zymogenus saltonus]
MLRKVAIVSAHQTKFEEKKADERFQEMCYPLVRKCLDDTGLVFVPGRGIDFAITCSDDFFDQRTISDGPMGDLVGTGRWGGEEKVACDGAEAIQYAAAGIASGHYDIVIVLAHAKESQVDSRNIVTFHAFEPFYTRFLGMDYTQALGLQAESYMNKWGVTEKQLAAIAVRAAKNGAKNPNAQRTGSIKVDDVMKSKVVVSPIKELDLYPVSDGAVCMILAEETKARVLTDKPVWITGYGNCYDSYYLGDRNLYESTSLPKAAWSAYRIAGIIDPMEEFDIAEISVQATYQEPLWYEGLGLAEQGKGMELFESGKTDMGGKLPVNPSGGQLCGNPLLLSGIVRGAEAFLQLRGEANGYQVKGAGRALVHGTAGPAGQFHTVLVLENDKAQEGGKS